MFQKNSSSVGSAHEPETIIAASVKVEGDFASQGNVLIEGVVEGSIKTERDLRVGEQARIAADVSALNAVVAGEILGNLTVGERLELEATARVRGDVRAKVLVVSAGASINGRLSMGEAPEERPASRAEERGRGLRAAAEKMRAAEAQRGESEHDEKVPAMAEAAAAPAEKKTVNPFFR
jgi:cytoskeletal protein CcmA (bactofilin family)